MTEAGPILIVVHPGSCCGSANANLGHYDARACRDGLMDELRSWTGALAVIDGELSDELSVYPVFRECLENALARNGQAGFKTIRIEGDAADEFDQVEAAKAIVERLRLSPLANPVRLTGAWTHGEADDGGCIDSIHLALQAAGFSVDVMDSAFELTN